MEPRIECPECGNEHLQRELRCPDCGHVAVPSLYKYRGFNVRSLSMLIDKTLYCPKAMELNDPFEFQFHVTEDSVNGVSIDEDSLARAQKAVKALRVICLSEISDNILMWSHYAGGHTGFCVEFERNEKNKLGNSDLCLPVVYQTETPTFAPAELESSAAFAKIVASKALDWAYEKEWCLIVRIEDEKVPLPGRITSIAFGCRMDREGQRTIAKILGPDMVYRKAIERKKTLGLEIRPIAFEEIVEGS